MLNTFPGKLDNTSSFSCIIIRLQSGGGSFQKHALRRWAFRMTGNNKELSRRDFLKNSLGVAGLLGALSLPVPGLLKLKRISGGTGDESRSIANQEAPHAEKHHAYGWVIDLRKCTGCVNFDSPPQCTQTCINAHFVPKGQQWIQTFTVELPRGKYFLPAPCMQCENAPCVNVCPVGATYHDKDGMVLIDHTRCIGCRMCMAACPYHRRFFNWSTPQVPPDALKAAYSPLYPVPAVKGTVIKCMSCAHLLREGRVPFCVRGCPTKALYVGDFNEDLVSNGREVQILSRFLSERNAYRLKEDLGTQPRVWYLPGHGEEGGRAADDKRELQPPVWGWGGDGYDFRPGVWPWNDPRLKQTPPPEDVAFNVTGEAHR